MVWDKVANIKYKRPAKETIYGEFIFSVEEITALKERLAHKNEVDVIKTMHLVNREAQVFAEITKTIYVAKKASYKEKIKHRKKS